jgi:hypothetical protein
MGFTLPKYCKRPTYCSILEQPAVEMWSGWCAKVISDHLGHGHKTGLPYIWKSEKPMVQLVSKIQEDSKVILWQVRA